MGFRLPRIVNAKPSLKRSLSSSSSETTVIPKGHFAVYVGEAENKRFVVPLSFLKHPSFQNLLSQAEKEFGFNHPMGALTIPCSEEAFIRPHLQSAKLMRRNWLTKQRLTDILLNGLTPPKFYF